MKGYLLDTHTLIWAISEPSRLGRRAVETLRDRGNFVVVSAASAWELYTRNRTGKLPGAGPQLDVLEEHIRRLRAELLSIERSHTCLGEQLEWSHRDPFDQMLATQTMHGLPALVARDLAFGELSSVTVLW